MSLEESITTARMVSRNAQVVNSAADVSHRRDRGNGSTVVRCDEWKQIICDMPKCGS